MKPGNELFYAIPQKDTKPLVKSLIQTFSSLSRVLDAAAGDLAKVEGCGASISIYLQAMSSMFAAYSEDAIR